MTGGLGPDLEALKTLLESAHSGNLGGIARETLKASTQTKTSYSELTGRLSDAADTPDMLERAGNAAVGKKKTEEKEVQDKEATELGDSTKEDLEMVPTATEGTFTEETPEHDQPGDVSRVEQELQDIAEEVEGVQSRIKGAVADISTDPVRSYREVLEAEEALREALPKRARKVAQDLYSDVTTIYVDDPALQKSAQDRVMGGYKALREQTIQAAGNLRKLANIYSSAGIE